MKIFNFNNSQAKEKTSVKNMKVKVLVISLAICLIAIASLGTLAWFNASDSVTNNFYIANSEDDPDKIFSVDVWEDDNDGVDEKLDSMDFDDILPGDNLYKEVNIENTGYYAQYIRATVTVTGATVWQEIFGDIYAPLSKLATDLNADFKVDRTVYNADEDTLTYVLYYGKTLAAQETVNLFTNISIPEIMDRFQASKLSGEFQITVTADAVQTENVGNTAIEAFTTVGMYEDAGEYTVVSTAKGLARILDSELWDRATLNNDLDLDDLINNSNEDNIKLDLTDGNIVIDSQVFNNGTLEITGGSIEADAAGFQNSGNATLNNVVVNAGSASDYSNITIGEDSETFYNDVDINSAGGGVAAADGATVVFNSGSIDVNSKSTSGRYLFYAVGEGTKIIINDGEFDFNRTQNQKRAYIYAESGTTVEITGGTFGKASTRSGYTAGIMGPGTIKITGGTFGFDPSAWVVSGYVATENSGVWTVTAQ